MSETLLDKYLKEHGISDAKFARRINTDRSSVWRYRTKRQRPEWRSLLAIYSETHGEITPNDFIWEDSAHSE